MKQVKEILKTLTVEEKASLLQGANFWNTKAIPEKGVPDIMLTDGPHGLRKQTGETDHLGVNKSEPATCFPSAAAIANSWDTELIYQVGQALGEECLQEGVSVLLGPGANIKRSPLCGRNFEYFSEDPYLSSEMAKNHILGVQSKGVGTSLKHFAVNNQETRRMSVNIVVDERTLREIYLASFETAVKEAQPFTIMMAYNRVNGEFCCENYHLLHDVLRNEWGYEGVIVSDWGATNDQVTGISEGFDLRMPYGGEHFTKKIVDAVKEGKLSEEKLNESAERVLTLVQKGVIGKHDNYTYSQEEHHALAVRAAEESAVILKNENKLLPLSKKDNIALIGGFAKNIRYQGGGSSHVNATVHENLIDVLAKKYPKVSYSFARGYRLKADVVDEGYISEAIKAAKSADKIVLCLGLPDTFESEGFDRNHMRIPNNQVDLLERLAKLGKPIVGLLFAGSPVEMPWLEKLDALFSVYTAGQGVAEGILRLVFGEANPCGKLAETYPLALGYTPCALAYPEKETAVYREGIFVGYRYYEKKELPVLFPFGFGLSYTKFEYSALRVSKQKIKDNETLTVTVEVKNTGKRAGKEIVQLYVRDIESEVIKPVKELKGFAKVSLKAGETQTVSFTLNKRSFAYYETTISDWFVESGEYEILVGASSADIRAKATVFVESTQVIKKKYDKFVTFDEMAKTPAGQAVLAQMLGVFNMAPPAAPCDELPDEEDDREIAMDYAAMGMSMPLIKTADMSGGMFTEEAVEEILKTLNK